jgi:regulator of RNase E activity RraA
MNLGERINPAVPPAPPELIARLSRIATPLISDQMSRLFGTRGLNRYNRTGVLAGTALTVKTRPGDNLYVFKAMTMIEPGHVLVVDAQGDTNNAILGELMKLYIVGRGCAGIIVDGAVRDVATFESTPCYARGVSHCGPYKSGPGEVNVPVSVGGMVVSPGDLLLGDEDGLVVLPRDGAEQILEAAEATLAKENAIKAEIATGARDQSWIRAGLARGGLEAGS